MQRSIYHPIRCLGVFSLFLVSIFFRYLLYSVLERMSHYERVRVISRIRPFTASDPEDADLAVVVVDKNHVSVDGKYVYSVDHVYPMEADTEEIFNEVVQPLLNDFLSGFNITLMAYGQTGTGKTFTMDGITPLAVSKIVLGGFHGNIEQLSFQYIEVYGDIIRDLLSDDPVESTKNLQLYDDTSVESGGTVLNGAVRVRARSLRQVMEVVEYGTRMRATGATNMNEYSSRSHSIFTIFNHRDKSKLHLVDLAGSERVGKTKNVGQRFQESIAINTGLLALGNVIRALRKNHSSQGSRHHVPYRSSKLTRLLQDSLGGNSKTVFIACIAPDSYNRAETRKTLEYCTLAQKVLNAPMPNYVHLYEEQCGLKHTGEDDIPMHEMCREGMVSLETFHELEQLKEKTDEEVLFLKQEVQRMCARVFSLEGELRQDETIFKRQIHEIQKLAAENDKWRRRVDYLEGRPHSCEMQTHSRNAQQANNVVQKVMRLHGLLGEEELLSHRSGSASADTLRAAKPYEMNNAPLLDTSTRRPLNSKFLSTTDDPDSSSTLVIEKEKHQSDVAAEIAKKAISYQTMNSELKGKMSTLEALVDKQRREAAMLRLELQSRSAYSGMTNR